MLDVYSRVKRALKLANGYVFLELTAFYPTSV